MNKNDVFTITIDGMTEDGSGVGRVDGGFAVFVPYALMGEVVSVKILKVQKRYAFGKVLEIISPSPMRTTPACEHFYRCGGCQYFHCQYIEELKYKEQKIRDTLAHIGGINTDVSPIIGALDPLRYRNKAQFPVSEAGVGFFSQRSHNVINIDSCIIQNPVCGAIVQCVRDWMQRCGVEPYNESKNTGNVRHIYIRSGYSGGEILVCIVTKETELKFHEFLIDDLLSINPNITGIVQNINPKPTNVILGNRSNVLYGRDFIYDNIGELTYKISLNSFYQVNSHQTKVLYDTAVSALNLSGDEVVWDLYSGIGTIGLYMAKSAKRIVGVEIVPSAVLDARENAKLNDIVNTDFYEGAAEDVAPKLLAGGCVPDVIVVDPPRKGCDAALLNTIVLAKPKKVLYISCKPSTLARDIAVLKGFGYTPTFVQPVDMFARTAHVETVVLLSHKNPFHSCYR